MKLLNIIKEINLGTDTENFIKGLKCGKKATRELQARYYGTSEGVISKEVTRSELKKIFYNNDSTFIFEKCVTKLKGVFNVL